MGGKDKLEDSLVLDCRRWVLVQPNNDSVDLIRVLVGASCSTREGILTSIQGHEENRSLHKFYIGYISPIVTIRAIFYVSTETDAYHLAFSQTARCLNCK